VCPLPLSNFSQFTDVPEVRRFRLRHVLHPETGVVSLNALVAKLKEAVGEEVIPSFVFDDANGDSVTVTTDRELWDAIQSSIDTGIPLKLVAGASKIVSEHCSQDRNVPITDPGVTNRIRLVLRERDCVDNKGNLVGAENYCVLTHLVEEFQSHVSAIFAPTVVATNRTTDRKNALFAYNINCGWHLSNYFAIDGIYIDLTKECEKADVNLLIPRPVCYKMKGLLGNTVISRCVETWGELQESCAFIDKENPPTLVFFREHLDEQGNPSGGIVAQDKGLLTDAMKLEDYKHIYKITGIFTLELVTGANQYVSDSSELHLVGLQVFSIHDNVLTKDKLINATAFGE
jgi:hypothetical protein